jgi:signal transduction histidine kinase
MSRSKLTGRARSVSILAAVAQFVILGVAIFGGVAVVAASRLRSTSNSEAIRDAREWAALMAEDVIAPHVSEALLRHDAIAVAEMDMLVKSMILKGPITRVKLWSPSGEVIYSDQHALIGKFYPLGPDVITALRTGKPSIGFSSLIEPENVLDGGPDKRLEVYMPFKLADGRTLIYEHYQHTSAVSQGAAKVTAAFSPIVLRSLLVLAILQVPLAWWLARRVRASQRQQMVLLQGALDASENERRRIAHDLHDGVVQDLVGVSYAVDAVRHDPAVRSSAGAVSTLDHVVEEAQRSIRSLRTLLVDIYPPRLEEGDLAGAIGDLLATLEARGIHCSFQDTTATPISSMSHALIYRTAREALRNVEKHSDATTVDLLLNDLPSGEVMLEIIDDGKGFDRQDFQTSQDDGHFGIRLLADVTAAAGGTLKLESEKGEGTRVVLVVPR